jgi:hypothetical protein
MDPDPDADPAIFVIDLLNAKKTNVLKSFSAYYFLKVLYNNTLFFKDKKSKRSHNAV